jgi:hypothetical protein
VHLSSFVLVITHDPPTTPHGHTPSIFLEGKGFSIERAHGHGLKDGGRNGSRTLCGVRAEGDQLDLRGFAACSVFCSQRLQAEGSIPCWVGQGSASSVQHCNSPSPMQVCACCGSVSIHIALDEIW